MNSPTHTVVTTAYVRKALMGFLAAFLLMLSGEGFAAWSSSGLFVTPDATTQGDNIWVTPDLLTMTVTTNGAEVTFHVSKTLDPTFNSNGTVFLRRNAYNGTDVTSVSVTGGVTPEAQLTVNSFSGFKDEFYAYYQTEVGGIPDGGWAWVGPIAVSDCSKVTEPSQTECEALLKLYDSTDGPNWTNAATNNWNVTATPCSWTGVVCSAGKVTELVVDNNNLSGPLPDFNLPNLVNLGLNNNQLTGSLPDFSALPDLEVVNFSSNQLSGAIPDFSFLPLLRNLDLNDNQLTGAVPDFFNLPNLEGLWLYNNIISGEIPDFSNLPNLTALYIHTNQLTGPIPAFPGLPNLTELSLYSNQLDGLIPDFSTNMPGLTKLILNDNQLSGTMPDFSALSSLATLSIDTNVGLCRNPSVDYSAPVLAEAQAYPECTDCALVSEIPQAECYALLALYDNSNGPNWADAASNNWNVTNTPCTSWAGVTCSGNTVTQLDRAGMNLTGTLVDVNLPNLTQLDLSANQLSGLVPNFSNLPNLTVLQLSANQLSSAIPDFSNLPSLASLALDSNQFSGIIPDLSPLTNLSSLTLHTNPQLCRDPAVDYSAWSEALAYPECPCALVTEIPQAECEALVDLYHSTNGANWSDAAGNNWLQTNTPCSWAGVTCSGGHVSQLDRGSNNLVGTLPDLNLPNLTLLSMRDNQLSGLIPDFSNLPNLTRLLLYSNQLSGSVPDFSNLPNLTELHLNSNNLTGPVPDFANISNLERLHLGSNGLSGVVPNFSNLPNLTILSMHSNPLSGSIPNFSNLPNLTQIFLYSSNLTGLVPDFSNLPNLMELHLNGNQLTGPVPDFSNLPSLTLLHLGSNLLSDVIPDFSNLPNLEKLYLGSNQLRDAIPDPSQLTNLLTFSLSDNPGLCRSSAVDYSDWLEALAYPLCDICTEVTEIPQAECEALVELYDSTDGANWSDAATNNWKVTNTPCSWTGVTCGGGSVTQLVRTGKSLSGSLPDLQLPNLIGLSLQSNDLSGPVPNFSNLSQLEELRLYSNQFSGSVPNFSALSNLEYLDLGYNQLTGLVPDFSNLPSLTELYLQNNQLTGSVPDFSSLSALTVLNLNLNQLSGPVPNFSNLPALTILILSANQLTGSIPDFSNLPNLSQLYLHTNQLSGPIPAFANLPGLTELWLGRNKLEGSIPLALGSLSSLTALDVSYNQLSGVVPNLPASLSSSDTDLGYNALTGETNGTATAKDPNWAATQTVAPTNLSAVAISDSAIRVSWTLIAYTAGGGYYQIKYGTNAGGPYPLTVQTANKTVNSHTINGLTAGTYFFVVTSHTPANSPSGNQNALTSLDSVEVSAEIPLIPLPPGVTNCPDVTEIPRTECEALQAFYLSTDGPHWSDAGTNGWNRGNTPCTWAGVACNGGHVTALDRTGSALAGILPDLQLPHLTTLALGGNQLSGSLPTFTNLSGLTGLDLHDNQFDGTIPTFSRLSLTALDLSGNNLSGVIPDFSRLAGSLNLLDNPDLCRARRINYSALEAEVGGFNLCPAGKIRFSSATYSGNEGEYAVIEVIREDGSDGPAAADYSIGAGTALPGEDYLATPGTLEWADGELGGKRFTVFLFGDDLYEEDEQLSLTLSATGADAGTPVAATLIIAGGGTMTPGTLQFTKSAYQVAESSGSARIFVTRVNGHDGPARVKYRTEALDNGATPGSDYTPISEGTLEWAAGEALAKSFTVSVIADTEQESAEALSLVLYNPAPEGVRLGTSATLTIEDTPVPGVIQFSTDSYPVAENAASVAISVTRGGDTRGSASVDYIIGTAGSSATAGADFTAGTGKLQWAAGETSQTFTVTLVDDILRESGETVVLALANPLGATLGNPASAEVQIEDDDTPPSAVGTVQFSAANYTEFENMGTITATVSRVGDSTDAASVSYHTDSSNNTATADLDFEPQTGTLTWQAGDTDAKNITIILLDDTEIEADETIYLSLGEAEGVEVGQPATATLTIRDDENDGSFKPNYTEVISSGTDNVCAIQRNGTLVCWGSTETGINQPPAGLFTLVSVGVGYACALGKDQRVQCWGTDIYGEAKPPAEAQFTQVSAGNSFSCGILTDSCDECLTCWGSSLSSDILATGISQVTVGWGYGCAIRENGTMFCPGLEGFPDTIYQHVSAGQEHACALNQDNTVLCRGKTGPWLTAPQGAFTQVSAGYRHSCGLTADKRIVCWGEDTAGETRPPAGQFTHLTAGHRHSCAVKLNGMVTCWGNNNHWKATPPSIRVIGHDPGPPPYPRMSKIDGGEFHTCRIDPHGTVKCWGDNRYGQLGRTHPPRSSMPLAVSGLGAAREIATGYRHTCALLEDGRVACWGDNRAGQTGVDMRQLRANPDNTAPTIIDGPRILTLAAGSEHTCAVVDGDASVYCWGDNRHGQLGTTAVPEPVSLADRAVDVAAGEGYTCALLESGGVQCWGKNDQGQLGNGDNTDSIAPVFVQGLTDNVKSLSTGSTHSCGILASGEIACWGGNAHGQLGEGGFDSQAVAKTVSGVGNVTAILARGHHSCVMQADGSIKCWGKNVKTDPVDNTLQDSALPVDIRLDGTAVDLGGGVDHTVALLETRDLMSWGGNDAAQMGLPTDYLPGSTTAVPVPEMPFFFQSSLSKVPEDRGEFDAYVVRAEGAPDTVYYTTGVDAPDDSTAATEGTDYLKAAGSLTWTANDSSSKPFKVSIINDDEAEDDEHIYLALYSSKLDTTPLDEAIVTIRANDTELVAVDDLSLYSTEEDKKLSISEENGILANDTISTFESVNIAVVVPDSGGEVQLYDTGAFTYTPAADFYGEYSFSYRLESGNMQSNWATVTIIVTPTNDPPKNTVPTKVLTIGEDGGLEIFDFAVADDGSATDLLEVRLEADAGKLSFLDPAGLQDTDPSDSVLAFQATLYAINMAFGNGVKFELPANPVESVTLTLTSTDPEGEHDSDTVSIAVTTTLYYLDTTVLPEQRGNLQRVPQGPGYPHGTEVTLTAQATDTCYEFSRWEGACQGSDGSTCALTIDADQTVKAYFAPRRFALPITQPANGGSIIRTVQETAYECGTTVTLAAAADPGFCFKTWSGHKATDLETGSILLAVIIDETPRTESISAEFESCTKKTYISRPMPNSYPPGRGAASLYPDKSYYDPEELVVITPHPANGYNFERWEGTTGDSTATVKAGAVENVTMHFKETTYFITVAASHEGLESLITISPEDPEGDGYEGGQQIYFEVAETEGYRFDHWEGDVSGSQSEDNLLITQDMQITAVFVPVIPDLDITPAEAHVVSGKTVFFEPVGGDGVYRWEVVNEDGGKEDFDGPYLNYQVPTIFKEQELKEKKLTVKLSSGDQNKEAMIKVYPPLVLPHEKQVETGEEVTFAFAGGKAPFAVTATNGLATQVEARQFVFGAPATEGTVIVTVHDALGQKQEAEVFVIAPPPLEVAPHTYELAPGGRLDLTAFGGKEPYQWQVRNGALLVESGAQTTFIAPEEPGSYSVKVTDGGEQSASANIRVNGDPQIMPRDPTRILDPDQAFKPVRFQVNSGLSPFTWSASEGEFLTDDPIQSRKIDYVPVPRSGTYVVTVTDDIARRGSASVKVRDQPRIQPVHQVATVKKQTDEESEGKEGKLEAELRVFGGEPPYTWEVVDNEDETVISEGVTTQGVNQLRYTAPVPETQEESYTARVKVRDAFGYEAFATVEVPGPLMISPSNYTAVVGEAVAFSAVGGTKPYKWPDGSQEQNWTKAFEFGGERDIEITDAAGNKAVSKVKVIPSALTVELGRQVTGPGEQIEITASGGIPPYTWIMPGKWELQGQQVSFKAFEEPGLYTLLISDDDDRQNKADVIVGSKIFRYLNPGEILTKPGKVASAIKIDDTPHFSRHIPADEASKVDVQFDVQVPNDGQKYNIYAAVIWIMPGGSRYLIFLRSEMSYEERAYDLDEPFVFPESLPVYSTISPGNQKKVVFYTGEVGEYKGQFDFFLGYAPAGSTQVEKDLLLNWFPYSITIQEPLRYVLSIKKEGEGSGTVTAQDLECGPECAEADKYYKWGKTVAVNATPAPGSKFAGWRGEGCDTYVTITKPMVCTVVFELE